MQIHARFSETFKSTNENQSPARSNVGSIWPAGKEIKSVQHDLVMSTKNPCLILVKEAWMLPPKEEVGQSLTGNVLRCCSPPVPQRTRAWHRTAGLPR
jgi:hypothetical protein